MGSDNSVCWSSSHFRASFERAFLTGMQIPRADVRKKRHGKNGAASDVPSRTACICSQPGDCGVFGWREDEDERVRHLGGEFKATYVSGLAHPTHCRHFRQAKRGGVLPRAGTRTTPKRTAHCRSRILIRTLLSRGTVDRPGRPGAAKSGARKEPARPHRGIQSESCQSY